MPRNRYADKANREARINGQTMEGKQLNPSAKAIDRLKMASLQSTGSVSVDMSSLTPAEYVRAYAKHAEARLSGELETIASIDEISKGKGIMSAVIRQKRD